MNLCGCTYIMRDTYMHCIIWYYSIKVYYVKRGNFWKEIPHAVRVGINNRRFFQTKDTSATSAVLYIYIYYCLWMLFISVEKGFDTSACDLVYMFTQYVYGRHFKLFVWSFIYFSSAFTIYALCIRLYCNKYILYRSKKV